MKIDSIRNINETEVFLQKSTSSQPAANPLEVHATLKMYSLKSSDKSVRNVVALLLVSNQNMLTEKHNDEKPAFMLLIVKN